MMPRVSLQSALMEQSEPPTRPGRVNRLRIAIFRGRAGRQKTIGFLRKLPDALALCIQVQPARKFVPSQPTRPTCPRFVGQEFPRDRCTILHKRPIRTGADPSLQLQTKHCILSSPGMPLLRAGKRARRHECFVSLIPTIQQVRIPKSGPNCHSPLAPHSIGQKAKFVMHPWCRMRTRMEAPRPQTMRYASRPMQPLKSYSSRLKAAIGARHSETRLCAPTPIGTQSTRPSQPSVLQLQ